MTFSRYVLCGFHWNCFVRKFWRHLLNTSAFFASWWTLSEQKRQQWLLFKKTSGYYRSSNRFYNSTGSSLNIASLARLLDFFVCTSIHVVCCNYVIACDTITTFLQACGCSRSVASACIAYNTASSTVSGLFAKLVQRGEGFARECLINLVIWRMWESVPN